MKTPIEKLELKHLAGYLPYKLMAEQTIFTQGRKKPHKEIREVFSVTIHNFFEINRYVASEHVKPILHPLSELTKYDFENLSVDFRVMSRSKNKLDLRFYMNFFDLEYLYSKHFDIHNLIESGLAIDINTLQS